MMQDRGYTIPIEQVVLLDEEKWKSKEAYLDRSLLSFIATRNNRSKFKVFFAKEETIVIGAARKFIEEMNQDGIKKGIVILGRNISSQSKRLISDASLDVSYFQEKELLFNVTKHCLTASHTLLDESETEDLLSKYRVKKDQLPRLLQKDPIRKYYGYKQGEIVNITGHSDTIGKYLNYRVVV